MHYVLSATDPKTGEKLSMNEVFSEANLMLSAGGDTTSIALAGTFFYLSRNPAVHDRLVAELTERFPTYDSIRSGQALNDCHYLRACIDETLRMSPPGPGAFFREVQASGATVCGHFLPAGVEVGIGIYAMHHHRAYFSDSDSTLR